MRRTSTVLAVVLVIQLILVSGIWLGAGQADGSRPEPLVALQAEEIESLRLDKGSNEDGIRLERSDDGWRLPDSDNYPAKAAKVENLVNELVGIQPGLPVASSAAAHGRFDLAEGSAQRRIVINEGQSDSVTLLIGKSPGASRVYTRRADNEAVYEIRFAAWQAEPDPANWFETDRVQIPIKDVARIELSDFALVQGDESGWSLEGAETSGEASVTKIKEFVAKAVQPTFNAVTSDGAPDEEPVAGYTVVTKEGSEYRFDYYSPGDDGEDPLLVRGDKDWRYRVGSELFDAVRQVEPAQFVASEDDASNAGATGSGESSSSQPQ